MEQENFREIYAREQKKFVDKLKSDFIEKCKEMGYSEEELKGKVRVSEIANDINFYDDREFGMARVIVCLELEGETKEAEND